MSLLRRLHANVAEIVLRVVEVSRLKRHGYIQAAHNRLKTMPFDASCPGDLVRRYWPHRDDLGPACDYCGMELSATHD